MEFKYKAWHIHDEYMIHHIDDLHFINGELSGISYEDREETNCRCGIKDVILLAYTGVKDIFEGDILKIPEVIWEGLQETPNAFIGSLTELYSDLIDVVTFEGGAFFIGDYHPLHSIIDLEIEKLGNIYENPNLLKNHRK